MPPRRPRAKASCPHEPLLERERRGGRRDDPDRDGEAEAEQQRVSAPARDDQAADALEQVRDGIRGRDVAEPVDVDQVPRRVHGREEEEDEEEGEETLDRLARAGAEREEEAERSEGDRDHRGEAEERQDPERSRGEVDADDQADCDIERGLDQTENGHARELADDQGYTPHRGQREPVQEARLDVLREIGSRVHGREEGPLDERDRERKGDEGIRGEAGQLRRLLEPAGVDEQEQHGEQQREDDRRGLPGRADDRASRERPDLTPEGVHTAGSAASASSSPAPSSERPVLARKTSSSEGAWISRLASVRPASSTARTTAGRPASPSRRRTATSREPPPSDSP